ncbi:uncharacterized protein IUM83_14805 [Phytophthora cinnamomi]|uniref:uncharacterized protein n=1 Tax=Phytophthora cinnamomi TaxID=4785 RepID=UPI00355A3ACB|nr:hypothetical protein IUM83_14805 [Phytophthora cinnamomi]
MHTNVDEEDEDTEDSSREINPSDGPDEAPGDAAEERPADGSDEEGGGAANENDGGAGNEDDDGAGDEDGDRKEKPTRAGEAVGENKSGIGEEAGVDAA